MRIAVLLNPASGRAATHRLTEVIKSVFADSDIYWFRSAVAVTSFIRRSAARSAGPALLLAVGGDGTVHHLVPFVVVRLLAAKVDQPGRKTVSTNRLLIGLPLYLIWYVVVAWVLFASDLPRWAVWTWLAVAPSCGVIAIHYWRRAGNTVRLLWHQLRVTLHRGTLVQLRKTKAQLRERIQRLATDYGRQTAAASE